MSAGGGEDTSKQLADLLKEEKKSKEKLSEQLEKCRDDLMKTKVKLEASEAKMKGLEQILELKKNVESDGIKMKMKLEEEIRDLNEDIKELENALKGKGKVMSPTIKSPAK